MNRFRAASLLLPLLGAVIGTLPVQAEETGLRSAEESPADTALVIDRIQVTAIKQGMALRSQPVASTIAGSRVIEREHIDALKGLSQQVPNLHLPDYGSRMTSSIYVRGLGARIDQPVIGLNIDNVPILQKNNFDAELADVERIEVLRGPQSTLYGRNTMGGVINVYTLSPLQYEGVRIGMEYASGNDFRLRASSYNRLNPDLGIAVTGFFKHSDGLFRNEATGERCDWERTGGGRLKLQWRNDHGLRIENTFAASALEQGGYPYVYVGPEIEREGQTVARSGEIAYNDPCSYSRTLLSDGLTIRYDAARFSVSSLTGYQYSDDEMMLDQDFLPLSYFTLRQALREHSLTEDLVFRSHDGRRYGWLFGLFGFYRHGTMEAPVQFKQTGIDELIFAHANGHLDNIRFEKSADALLLASDFRTPSCGGALYHESRFTAGKWHFTAGLRIDIERTTLHYHSQGALDYKLIIDGGEPIARTAAIDDRNRIAHTYAELLPKFSALYAFDEQRNLYLTVAKGYKAGGFNTQIFSDMLQEKLKQAMLSDAGYQEQDMMSYKPEYSWNYEFGGHFSCMEGAVRGDFALFYIDCRDQQLTVFPAGSSTGRMMTNAGRTRSWGAEWAMQCTPWRTLDLSLAYGYTDARFVRYDNGQQDFRGNFLPYAPQQTLSVSAMKTFPTGVRWLGDLVVQAGLRGTGRIRWNEENTLVQPFYTLFDASIRIEHPHYTLDIWGRNLANERCDVFYFKSIGHEFVQRGRPRTFGITLSINL